MADKVPNSDPNAFCRLCFADRNLIALYDPESPQQFLVDLILESIGIQIINDANSPTSICWRCAVSLEDFHMLRMRSLEHDAIIQDTYGDTFYKNQPEHATKNEDSNSEGLIEEMNDQNYDNSQLQETLPDSRAMYSDSDDSDGFVPREENSNTEPKVIKCYSCHFEFDTHDALYAHIEKHHFEDERPFKCAFCPAAFKRKHHLTDHMGVHGARRQKLHECRICRARFTKGSSLVQHRRKVHLKIKNKKTKAFTAACKFCPEVFYSRNTYNTHQKTHYDILPFVCELCGSRFSSEKGKYIHKSLSHNTNDLAGKLIVHQCQYCPESFPAKKQLIVHLRKHPYKEEPPSKNTSTENRREKAVAGPSTVTVKMEAEDYVILDD
ncbi:zinc finger protein 37 homolog [Uranotaenia lowii]|uniref:zinc finger protein 37 homolog n=1 Tax=Uranotaenia lowii TaxID=190385 RepID=UPI00247B2D7E|nr:zinc finger protein 37 homolog [Uranotaenia lowii]